MSTLGGNQEMLLINESGLYNSIPTITKRKGIDSIDIPTNGGIQSMTIILDGGEMVNKKFINELQLKEMVTVQLNGWELLLKHKGRSQQTIDRKISNVGMFYMYLTRVRNNTKKRNISVNQMNDLAFDFICNGYFSDSNIENEGCYEYRLNIYNNIREAINYVYEDYFKDRKEIIKPLTEEQKEILKDISKNKWFKVNGYERTEENLNENIQVKLLEELGIKVYFDADNKPYALSHELAELIRKEKSKVRRDMEELSNKIGLAKIGQSSEYLDITTVEDFYINSQNKQQPTLRLYKDILLLYVLGLTGKDIIEFKLKYIQAFNYIKEQHNKLLIENAELKKSFLNMYNEVRKRNRDLLIHEHNKKCNKKKAS